MAGFDHICLLQTRIHYRRLYISPEFPVFCRILLERPQAWTSLLRRLADVSPILHVRLHPSQLHRAPELEYLQGPRPDLP